MNHKEALESLAASIERQHTNTVADWKTQAPDTVAYIALKSRVSVLFALLCQANDLQAIADACEEGNPIPNEQDYFTAQQEAYESHRIAGGYRNY